MERRRLLAAAVAGGSIAGCLDGLAGPSDDGSSTSYERCEGRAAIDYREFPAALQEEIDAAIEGGYAPDDRAIHLDDAVDLETTYVVRDGYYVGSVDDGTLTLEADPEPTGLDASRAITVLVKTDASVELVREGEVLRTFAHNAVFSDVVWGGYELVVDHEDGGARPSPSRSTGTASAPRSRSPTTTSTSPRPSANRRPAPGAGEFDRPPVNNPAGETARPRAILNNRHVRVNT